MYIPRIVLSLALTAGFVVPGCASAEDDLSEEALTSFSRLDRVNAELVAWTYANQRRADIAKCAAAHPSLTTITAQNVGTFTQIEDVAYTDLQAFIEHRLGSAAGLTLTDLRRDIEKNALAELKAISPPDQPAFDYDALFRIPANRDVLSRYRTAYITAAEDRAIGLVTSPAAVDVRALREKWRAVEYDRAEFDCGFLRPVAFVGVPTVGDLRKAYGIKGSVVSKGTIAIDKFAANSDAAGGAATFKPVGEILKHPRIKQRYYFIGPTTHVLLVVDEWNHAYGVSVAYAG